jgi:predicted RND superfamily exporter protein
VVPALVYSTIAIAVGFGVVGLSDFTLIRNLGLVTSAMVVICLIADLTLLPALLVSNAGGDEIVESIGA